MDSKFAKAFAAFDTIVYDEDYFDLLGFLSDEFGQKKTIRTIKDTKNKLYDWWQNDIEELEKEIDFSGITEDQLKAIGIGKKITKKKKKQLDERLDHCLKKFDMAGFINLNETIVESIEPDKIWKFREGLPHIKKSQERGTRWLIYYYYMNRKKKTGRGISIPLTKLENGLKDFKKIKNYQKLVEQIVLDCKDELDIKFNKKTRSIYLGSDIPYDSFLPLLSALEDYNRAEAGTLENKIVNMVEYQPFANKEIVSLTGADKGHVSKVMKRLFKEKLITPVGKSGNFQYWLTNCDKCPFDKDKKECGVETSAKIIQTVKAKLGIQLEYGLFTGVDNHILRNMNLKLLTESYRDFIAFSSSSPSDSEYLKFYDSVIGSILGSMKEKTPKEKLQKMHETMPRLYSTGFRHGLDESRKYEYGKIFEIMEKVGIKPGDIEKFEQEYVKYVNEVDYK